MLTEETYNTLQLLLSREECSDADAVADEKVEKYFFSPPLEFHTTHSFSTMIIIIDDHSHHYLQTACTRIEEKSSFSFSLLLFVFSIYIVIFQPSYSFLRRRLRNYCCKFALVFDENLFRVLSSRVSITQFFYRSLWKYFILKIIFLQIFTITQSANERPVFSTFFFLTPIFRLRNIIILTTVKAYLA